MGVTSPRYPAPPPFVGVVTWKEAKMTGRIYPWWALSAGMFCIHPINSPVPGPPPPLPSMHVCCPLRIMPACVLFSEILEWDSWIVFSCSGVLDYSKKSWKCEQRLLPSDSVHLSTKIFVKLMIIFVVLIFAAASLWCYLQDEVVH